MKKLFVFLSCLVFLSGCAKSDLEVSNRDQNSSILEKELKQCVARSEEQYQVLKNLRECIRGSWKYTQDKKIEAFDEFSTPGDVLNSHVDEDIEFQQSMFSCLNAAEKPVPFYPSIIFTPS